MRIIDRKINTLRFNIAAIGRQDEAIGQILIATPQNDAVGRASFRGNLDTASRNRVQLEEYQTELARLEALRAAGGSALEGYEGEVNRAEARAAWGDGNYH